MHMDGARLNVFWFLSLVAPALIMLAASTGRRVWLSLGAAMFSLAVTYWLCLLSVARKWEIRASLATTDVQKQWVYDLDGANQAFTAIVTGPLEAIAYTILWGLIGWKLASMYQSRPSSTSMESTRGR
jgi:hypothetical protein